MIEIDPIEKAQDAIHTASERILNYFGITKHHRYAGSFPSDTPEHGFRLTEVYAVRDEYARDEMARALQDLVDENKLDDATITVKNDDKSFFPYTVKLSVNGQANCEKAYKRMAAIMQAAAKRYPENETPLTWDAFASLHNTNDSPVKNPAQAQMRRFGLLAELFNANIAVAGSHTSKSIALPVVRLMLPHNQTLVTVRDNFHDTCVTVKARFPVDYTPTLRQLFKASEVGGYFEGFEQDRHNLEPHCDNHRNFALTVGRGDDLVLLMAELQRQDKRHLPPILPKSGPR